jgi:hypothetical protein
MRGGQKKIPRDNTVARGRILDAFIATAGRTTTHFYQSIDKKNTTLFGRNHGFRP